jgi:hypothetical protein
MSKVTVILFDDDDEVVTQFDLVDGVSGQAAMDVFVAVTELYEDDEEEG